MIREILMSVIIFVFITMLFSPIMYSDSYGVQEEVVPWPQFLHDARHTGKTPFGNVPTEYKVLWKYETEDNGFLRYIVVSKNNEIYSALRTSGSTVLYMLHPNGSLKRKVVIKGDTVGHSPAVDENGTIYEVSAFATPFPYMQPLPRKIIAYSSNGDMVWNITLNKSFADLGDPVLYGNRIYVSSYGESLYAISTNGEIIWGRKIHPTTIPSIDNNGNIFLCSGKYLYSLSPSGNIRWKVEIGRTWWASIPAIDKYGNVYVANENGTLYRVNPDGSIKWKYSKGGHNPVIDDERRSLYFLSEHFKDNKDNIVLYSLDMNTGRIKWTVTLMACEYPNWPTLSFFRTIGGDGSVYISGGFVKNNSGFIYAVSPNGNIKLHIEGLEGVLGGYTNPVIDKNGTIYIGGTIYAGGAKGILYAIGGYVNESKEKSTSSWIYYSIGIVAAVLIVSVVVIYRLKRR